MSCCGAVRVAVLDVLASSSTRVYYHVVEVAECVGSCNHVTRLCWISWLLVDPKKVVQRMNNNAIDMVSESIFIDTRRIERLTTPRHVNSLLCKYMTMSVAFAYLGGCTRLRSSTMCG